jgi:hypothetical protein
MLVPYRAVSHQNTCASSTRRAASRMSHDGHGSLSRDTRFLLCDAQRRDGLGHGAGGLAGGLSRGARLPCAVVRHLGAEI